MQLEDEDVQFLEEDDEPTQQNKNTGADINRPVEVVIDPVVQTIALEENQKAVSGQVTGLQNDDCSTKSPSSSSGSNPNLQLKWQKLQNQAPTNPYS